MPGPPPNPNARRRHDRTAGFTRLPAVHDGPVPALPGGDWHPATVAAWRSWWTSPQATQWIEADVPSLYLMAQLFDRSLAGSAGAAAEFRQWADRFGLSPLGRLRNRWLVEGDDPDTSPPPRLTAVPLSTPKDAS